MKDYIEGNRRKLKTNNAKPLKKQKKQNIVGKSDTYSKKRKPNFGNALAKAAIKKFTGLDIEDWGHN